MSGFSLFIKGINNDKSDAVNSVTGYKSKCPDVLRVLQFFVSTNLLISLFSKCVFVFSTWLQRTDEEQNRTRITFNSL